MNTYPSNPILLKSSGPIYLGDFVFSIISGYFGSMGVTPVNVYYNELANECYCSSFAQQFPIIIIYICINNS